MSLGWNLTKIANRESLCWLPDGDSKKLNPITEALIWRSLSLDLGEITEKNASEWLFRTRYYSQVFGRPLNRRVEKGGHESVESFDFSIEDIRRHIGLHTNVSTKSRKSFLKRIGEQLECEVERDVRRELEVKCPKCEGSGKDMAHKHEDGTPAACEHCDGYGKLAAK